MSTSLPGDRREDPPSAVDRCADALRAAIVSESLAPGARLPPERTLAAALGVNRTTLRAALHEVARGGLLGVRQGSGYVVRDFRTFGGPDLAPALVALARSSGDLVGVCAELLRVRRWIAGALLESVGAAQLDPSAIAGVRDAIDALEAHALAGAPPTALAAADLAVVRAWIVAADARVLGLFLHPIASVLEGIPELSAAMFATPAANVAAWRGLAALAEQGPLDGDAVRSVLELLAARDRATLTHLAAPEPR